MRSLNLNFIIKDLRRKNGEVSGVDVTVHRPDIFLNVKWI